MTKDQRESKIQTSG